MIIISTIYSYLEVKMYPSLDNNGSNQPRTSFFCNYSNDINHSRTPQEHYYHPFSSSSSSCFQLPSPHYIPLEDEAIFCEFFQQQQFFSNDLNYHNTITLAHEQSTDHEMTANMESTMGECSNNNGRVEATNDGDDDHYDFNTRVEAENSSHRKRPSKRDRHSKINTARGPRDRRMRLSLDVAKKLFGLQDLLGFDKASRTVDWLLTKSKTSIQELLPDPSCSFMGVSNSASSTSECEVLSGTGDQSMVKTADEQASTKNKAKPTSGSRRKEKDKIVRVRRSTTNPHHPLAKATRERARARARERTMVKRNNRLGGDQDTNFSPCMDRAIDPDINRLGSWSLFEESQVQTVDQPDQIRSHVQFKQGFVRDNSSLMMAANWSPSYLLNYQHSAGLTYDQQQVNDFQITGKAREGNNN